jgi:hypothetical protein
MVSKRSLQDGTAVRNLSRENGLRNLRREFQIVRPAVLLPPEENVSRNRTLDFCQKPTVFRQEAYRHVIFCTKTH